MRRYDYYRPESLDEALRLEKELSGSRFIAGGTDLMVQVKNKEIQAQALISLRSVAGLSEIDVNRTARIGSLTTISDLACSSKLKDHYPLLVDAAKRVGSVQVRNVATIGGNLCNCSPCSDMALPLLVLEARVKIQNTRTTQEIPIEEFFLGPGQSCLAPDEIMTEILLSAPQPQAQTLFLKKGRVQMDLAVASVAILLELKDKKCMKARIAAGSVAPVPFRLKEVENFLEGSTLTAETMIEAKNLAEKSVSPITDIRSTEEYRRSIIGVYVQRGLRILLERNRS
jgi:carbon-monoxide dehydrogenase medium subunit